MKQTTGEQSDDRQDRTADRRNDARGKDWAAQPGGTFPHGRNRSFPRRTETDAGGRAHYLRTVSGIRRQCLAGYPGRRDQGGQNRLLSLRGRGGALQPPPENCRGGIPPEDPAAVRTGRHTRTAYDLPHSPCRKLFLGRGAVGALRRNRGKRGRCGRDPLDVCPHAGHRAGRALGQNRRKPGRGSLPRVPLRGGESEGISGRRPSGRTTRCRLRQTLRRLRCLCGRKGL